ncbi:MAG: Lrp/AsnC family transcriptional regulator, partial [Nanoarchaeota archaeon]|nr:Lrp/AsnC family transcriptional regulator [Nanoarchaeota archaeon]
ETYQDIMMNELAKNLLRELTLNSKQSDRVISKKLKITQPTVSRLRKKLENDGLIEKYTLIPNLEKLGIEFVTFITLQWKDYSQVKELEEFNHFLKCDKRVLFSAPGEGFEDKTKIIMTFHKNYRSYELFLREIRANWKDYVESMDSFLVSTSNIITNFDFNIINRIDE